jgi:hypothetical protein
VATADIQPGECVVNVPTAAAIRVYPGCPTVFQIPSNMWEALPWYGQLALTLLHEAQLGPASKWADYIKQLPTAVDVPVLWSDQEVQQLSCSYIISQVSSSTCTLNHRPNAAVCQGLAATATDGMPYFLVPLTCN